MRIPFDIKFRPQIESGEYKVETKSGRPIRVLAWDLPCDFPIATAEFTEDNRVIVESYSVDGWVGYGEKENNLVIVTPEPELTEFEKEFDRLAELYHSDGNPDEIACCKEYAARLLEIARKQLQPEIDAEIEKAKTADEVQYKKGREDLLQELFKDSSTEELEKELKIFHDIFKNKDCSASAIRNWAQLFRVVAQKEYFVKTNLTASETIKEAIRTEYEKGRAEALKDLPRWREWDNGAAGNSEGHPIALVSGAGGIRFVSVLGVTGEKYIMLDDLKKLPGFKED